MKLVFFDPSLLNLKKNKDGFITRRMEASIGK